MSQELMQTLCDHSMGNYRALCTMAAELLSAAAQQEKTQLDEMLYLVLLFLPPPINESLIHPKKEAIMDRPVLIIEMPDLSYEQAAGIGEFLHALINVFENHYARQCKEYKKPPAKLEVLM